MPPRPLLWTTTAAFLAASVLWPVLMSPKADLLRLPTETPFDVFYGFWLPVTRTMPAGWAWGLRLLLLALITVIPWFTGPTKEEDPGVAIVNERICTGCEQCYIDCPYEAIAMAPRTDGREGIIAIVEASKCTGCDICAASCAPMCIGVGDQGGREQLAEVGRFMEEHSPGSDDVVLIACDRSSGGAGRMDRFNGAPVFPVPCAGSLHTSVIERFVKLGVGGVMVVSCNPGDCWNREGVRWLDERVHHDREAELKARVDRRRVRVSHAGEGETRRVVDLLTEFRGDLEGLEGAATSARETGGDS
jgi:coenzyme F420-reducing hydrogenase delta subunit/Pyruvate/2-oxoacid:ferredoxin oxidoreductase delta subunit